MEDLPEHMKKSQIGGNSISRLLNSPAPAASPLSRDSNKNQINAQRPINVDPISEKEVKVAIDQTAKEN